MLMNDLLRQADLLPLEQQLALAAQMLARVRARVRQTRPIKWRDVRGMYAYPATGQDAQQRVNKLRDEWDR